MDRRVERDSRIVAICIYHYIDYHYDGFEVCVVGWIWAGAAIDFTTIGLALDFLWTRKPFTRQ
jgi:hypothetical protein